MLLKRLFDIVLSACGILLFLAPGLVISILIVFDSPGGVFFRQRRLGKDFTSFYILKFRTMVPDAETLGPKVSPGDDPRITRVGRFLRRYKLDELPQLINVLTGDMSFVGPRPEVEEYVYHFKEEYLEILSVRPGITDQASIDFIDEGKRLQGAEDPETLYLSEILPKKIALNKAYLSGWSLKKDLVLIVRTVGKLFSQ